MKRIVLMLTVAAMLALAMVVSVPYAFAVNSSSCDFSRGQTVCTTVHGSHGDQTSHHGQVNSNGSTTPSPGPCKVTGSTHTC